MLFSAGLAQDKLQSSSFVCCYYPVDALVRCSQFISFSIEIVKKLSDLTFREPLGQSIGLNT